ncbi:secreted RxLR effector protein 161-like [Primulina tabacum]|uniref:secreted RxLR effector protein 161-like n=1 Tax=Primulina tabacum TaxID=48773 RepID=UPI003F5AA557
MYGMISTLPDVAYALSVASRYPANPGQMHWKAVKDILKYLRRTENLFIVYESGELKLEGYTDSSFQIDKDDSKSTSGFVFMVNGVAVSWKSSKQDSVADSTAEAKYNVAAKETVWMRNFVQDLGVIPNGVDPVLTLHILNSLQVNSAA